MRISNQKFLPKDNGGKKKLGRNVKRKFDNEKEMLRGIDRK